MSFNFGGGNFSFGAPNASVPSFGTPITQQTTPAQAATSATSTAPQLGLSFGGLNAPTATAAAPAPSFAFGATTTSAAPPTGLTFGAPASTATTAPAFGSFNPTSTATTAPAFGSFNPTSTATTAPAFGSFNPASATTAPAFGSFNPATTSSALFSSKPVTSTPGTGFAFGAQATTTTAPPSIGAGFGLTATTTTTSTASNPLKIGLGGVDVNATQPKATEGRADSAKVKENQLPQEIIATVDLLKAHIKQQKSVSSDIVRASSRKLSNVTSELARLSQQLIDIHTKVETNHTAIKQLRAETSKAIQEAEIAQRTHDASSGPQFENNAPLLYFTELIRKFESDMVNIRKQLELTENHMRSLANPQAFTPDDLKKGLQQIHECFVALAGRLQETHRAVEIQNEQFLNFLKHRGKGKAYGNVYDGSGSDFDGNNQAIQQIVSGSRAIIPNVACGPTPFSSFSADRFGTLSKLKSNITNVGQSGNMNAGVNTSGWSLGATNSGSTSQFNLGSGFGNLFGSTDPKLNLEPAIGSKRNKH